MSRLSRGFSWKLFAVVCMLCLLSLLAPSLWRGMLSPARPSARAQAASLGKTPKQSLSPTIEAEKSLDSTASDAMGELVAYETPPLIVPSGPLVAEQIDLDPSLVETPARPRSPRVEELSLPGPILEPATPAEPATNDGPSLSNEPILRNASSRQEPATPPPGILPVDPTRPNPADILSTGDWPRAIALIEQLRALAEQQPASAAWANEAIAELERLAQIPAIGDAEAASSLTKLVRLAEQAKQQAKTFNTDEARSRLLRAGYALNRRLMIWQQVHALANREVPQIPAPDAQQLRESLAAVEHRLHEIRDNGSWRQYLLLDQAAAAFDAANCAPADQRQLAYSMLVRLHSTQLSYDQQQFLHKAPFDDLAKELKARAEEPVELIGLLRAIEAYEDDGLSAESIALAERYQQLRFSTDAATENLGETLNAYYRNANVRVAISGELVNRLLPKESNMYEPVQDQILGAQVHGDSTTRTQLRLVLLPDRQRWNVGLEAKGAVSSNTSSSKGPATFHQQGLSFFRARKSLHVDRRGIRLFGAEAEANANNELSDYETNFDGIPLLGSIARSIARSQYDQQVPLAQIEVEGKIRVRATSTLDQQVREKIEQAKKDFQVKLLGPLQRLEVDPTPVDLETTQERLIARYRLAGREQLSAHTPRPQAPGDSLLSVQVHETALNNILEHLKLHGRQVELRQFYTEITERFNRTGLAVPEELPEGVSVTFADEDPVRVDCEDGHVRLTIRLKELAHGTRKWKNFAVRGYYVPDGDQLDANLVRDGIIELIGPGLGFGDQVALRGIFSRVLSKNRKLNVVNNQISIAPELKDQQVTQFVIHDGWLGVALGPKLPGRAGIAKRPLPKNVQR